jgi:hypothetical protein
MEVNRCHVRTFLDYFIICQVIWLEETGVFCYFTNKYDHHPTIDEQIRSPKFSLNLNTIKHEHHPNE